MALCFLETNLLVATALKIETNAFTDLAVWKGSCTVNESRDNMYAVCCQAEALY